MGPAGAASLDDEDPLKYKGEWKDDKAHGKGSFQDIKGGKYKGDWKEEEKRKEREPAVGNQL